MEIEIGIVSDVQWMTVALTRAKRGLIIVADQETIRGCDRVRKSKNFPDSKISTAKTFRIKCVNRNVDDFATNARKT